MTSKVVIARGSGALGARLVTSLAGKCDLVVQTRSPNPNANVRQIYWDGKTVGRWASELGAPDTALTTWPASSSTAPRLSRPS